MLFGTLPGTLSPTLSPNTASPGSRHAIHSPRRVGRAMRLPLTGILAAALIAGLPAPSAFAQQPAGSESADIDPAEIDSNVIRVGVEEVIVPVTVTDREGRFVSNLRQQDFTILDQGVEQSITYFSAERNQPVVVGFLMDLSNASKIRWENYRESAIELALTLLPGDPRFSGYLIGYGSESEVLVNTTSNTEPIVEKLYEIEPGGGAALYDAIHQAVTDRTLVKGEPIEPRRVVIIIGDGHDNASSYTLDQVEELAQRNLVTIYAISTEAYGYLSDGSKNLRRLAEATGGRVEYPLLDVYDNTQGFLSRPSDLGNFEYKPGTGGYASVIAQAIFGSIAALAGEITTQYILRYVPNVPTDEEVQHEVKVMVNLPTVTVRARQFYYPNNP